MEATPREGEAAKGGEPQGGDERDIEHGCELARYPFRRETSGWRCLCGSLATNIYTFKPNFNLSFFINTVHQYVGKLLSQECRGYSPLLKSQRNPGSPQNSFNY